VAQSPPRVAASNASAPQFPHRLRSRHSLATWLRHRRASAAVDDEHDDHQQSSVSYRGSRPDLSLLVTSLHIIPRSALSDTKSNNYPHVFFRCPLDCSHRWCRKWCVFVSSSYLSDIDLYVLQVPARVHPRREHALCTRASKSLTG
jgi:hypothetical protein